MVTQPDRRWLRADSARFMRPDAARFLKPGGAGEAVSPTGAQRARTGVAGSWAAHQASLHQEVTTELTDVQLALSKIHDEFSALKSALQSRRIARAVAEESWRRKYSPDQPRIPAGNSRGGQWTSGSGGQGSDRPEGALADLSSPMGDIDFGNLDDERGSLSLFDITPRENSVDGVQLAGDLPRPDDPPPDIPAQRPKTSAERTYWQRAASEWMARNPSLAGAFLDGALKSADWLEDYQASILTNRDPPKSLEELQEGVGIKRPGYETHHIEEQSLLEKLGFSRSQRNDPDNPCQHPQAETLSDHWLVHARK